MKSLGSTPQINSLVTQHVAAESQSVVTAPLTASNNWYDFTVRNAGSNTNIRLAGRIEIGIPTTTDPYMSGV
jgi:hypothetical protein